MATVKDAHRPYVWTAFLVTVPLGAATLFLAAWDLPPVNGVRVIAVLLYTLGALSNACVAALVAGLVIEWVHRPWAQGRSLAGHIALVLLTLVLLAGVIFFDRWVWYHAEGADMTWFLSWVVVASVAAVTVRVFALKPTSYDARRETISVSLGAGIGGLVLGALLVVLVIGAFTLVRVNGVRAQVPDPSPVDLAGRYVALGDSYAAGEGLRPFEAGTEEIGCNRSDQAFARVLASYAHQLDLGLSGFVACSGAVTSDIYHPRATGVAIQPQVPAKGPFPDVHLVTITIGGNDVQFAQIVERCFEYDDCVHDVLSWPSPAGDGSQVATSLADWAPQMLRALGTRVTDVYDELRQTFPDARIVVIGYPYLFPGGDVRPSVTPDDCAIILRRFSTEERAWIRAMSDRFNDLLYEHAAVANLEFVSPAAVWAGHEPCGHDGQYTNGIKLSMALANPVDGGSFHPNPAGQRQFAVLLACYLKGYPRAPDPFIDTVTPVGALRAALDTNKIDGLARPEAVGLREAPGTPGSHLTCPTSP
jgi:lysophospholipase L1-like esterase